MNDDYVDVSEMMKRCSIVRRKTMYDSYIAPALADGSIERKFPQHPNHPKQMYRLTEKAKIWKKLDVFCHKMTIMSNNRTWLCQQKKVQTYRCDPLSWIHQLENGKSTFFYWRYCVSFYVR